MASGSSDDYLALMRDVYDFLLYETESFEEQNIGSDAFYLMGAIMKGTKCEWPPGRPIVTLLRNRFDPDHVIWSFIEERA